LHHSLHIEVPLRKVIAPGHAHAVLGCELAQGYGIARPMLAADMLAWANSWQPGATCQLQPRQPLKCF